MATYRVLAVPTTPLSEMERVLNEQGAADYDLVTHFFGSDGTHHVAGGVGPDVEIKTVTDPRTGLAVRAAVSTNKIVMIFRHA